jgi:hypothetical protein
MSGSYYTLDAKYNTLQAEIDAIIAGGGGGGSQNLASVLTNGNSAGVTDINMNARNILACNNLDVTTINSAAYPPVVPADNLQAVLTAGNTADLGFNLTDINGFDTSSIVADIPATFSSLDVAFASTSPGVTASSLIKSQLSQTEYSTSVTDGTQSATKNLFTTITAITDNDTTTDGTQTAFSQATTGVGVGANTLQSFNSGAGQVNTLTTTCFNTLVGQSHLFKTTGVDESSASLNAGSGGSNFGASYQTDAPNIIISAGGDVNTGAATLSVQATSLTSVTSQLLRMEAGLTGDAMLEHLVSGAGTQNLKIQSSNNLLLTSDNLTSTATNFKVLSTAAGGGGVPLLTLTNTNATGSVAMEVYKDKPTIGANGDVLFTQSVFGKDTTGGGAGTKQEYTRITHTIRNPTSGVEDGSLELGAFVDGAYQNFIQLNANDAPIGEVNVFRPLDFVVPSGASAANATIRLSGAASSDLDINGSSSAGSGHINLTSKTGTFLNVAANINVNATASTGNGDVNLLTKRGVVVNLNDEVIIDTTGSTTTGDIDITTKSGGITTISSSLINLNSIGGGAVNLNSTGNIGLTIAAGSSLVILNLPSVPNLAVPGSLWNNGGVLNIV